MAENDNLFDPQEIFTNVVQIGIVVRDLDQTLRGLTEIFGMGPFRIVEWPPPDRGDWARTYYGQPAEFTARMAFADLGSVEIELIQPVAGSSIWADFLREHGGGIHHIRFNTFDLAPVEAYLAGQGIGTAQNGLGIRSGTRWTNFDSVGQIGFIIEVMQALRGTSGRTPASADGDAITSPGRSSAA